jgi:hypothetical protein
MSFGSTTTRPLYGVQVVARQAPTSGISFVVLLLFLATLLVVMTLHLL